MDFLVAIIVSIIGGIVFFIVDLFNENKTREIHSSVIAGISVAYFFLVVLPEISENMPEYPLHLRLLEYLFVLIGFTFIHVSEKYILQKVDSKAQDRIKRLLKMEKNLDLVEQNLGHILKSELGEEDLDDYALKDLSRVLVDLIEQEETLKEQDKDLKRRIQSHINENLDNIHLFTNFIYHFLIGLIFFNLLLIELLIALLFFLFALFKAIISKTSNDVIIFPEIEVIDRLEKPKGLRIFLASATFLGFFIGVIFELTAPISLEILYVLFSFISGVILYIIVREVIPEKEKGNPVYFLLGVIIFFIAVLIIRFLGYSLMI
ncbi:MAG: hypothetical protein EU544_02840 [Promethearchaeota archaeon]|nr:MAG: hypothetical protein EU544_02840 [Candidatus Lokiarchaeota archaeon]